MISDKRNYTLLAISVGIIMLGLLLISDGGSANSTGLTAEIFNTRRIMMAPIVTLVGFLLIICAIAAKPKGPNRNNGKDSDAKSQSE